MTSIGKFAFRYCRSLKSITIPNSVTSIHRQAFAYCRSVTTITFNGTKAQWEVIEKDSSWCQGTNNGTIRCIDGQISTDDNTSNSTTPPTTSSKTKGFAQLAKSLQDGMYVRVWPNYVDDDGNEVDDYEPTGPEDSGTLIFTKQKGKYFMFDPAAWEWKETTKQRIAQMTLDFEIEDGVYARGISDIERDADVDDLAEMLEEDYPELFEDEE